MSIRQNILGKGSFGHVYLVTLNGIDYALKCCLLPKDDSSAILDKEIQVNKKVEAHKNITQLYKVYKWET